ncbi:peroxiredoxin-like family protein [Teichococcus aerophilus]|nr:peroxiredoxin-like family protein [Pseudoroseomonas aerophila]
MSNSLAAASAAAWPTEQAVPAGRPPTMAAGALAEGTLQAKLAALHAERVRSWSADDLADNIGQRQRLAARFRPGQTLQPGQAITPFSLTDTAGGLLHLANLVANGPAVLVFFRFAGCPACNIAIPHYRDTLAPVLASLGVPLVAVSPQVPERLRDIHTRHALPFAVASDLDNVVARRLGILFSYDEKAREASRRKGQFIGDVTGTATWELPMPAAIVLDQHCRLRFIDASPDWLVRTESGPIIQAVRQALDHPDPA